MTEQVTILSQDKQDKDAVKRQLLVSMQEKRKEVMSKLSHFMKQDLNSREDYITLAKGIVDDIDSVLNENDYESSLFLRNTVKPLKKMRENAMSVLEQYNAQDEIKKGRVPALTADKEPVYILLFQQQGHNIKKWAQLLNGLDRYVLGRPIFASEEDAKKVIRLKHSEDQEGYVKVAVSKAALEKNAGLSRRTDRYGNTLLSLPAGSISSQCILEFVHGKKRYHFIEGELVDVSGTTERN